ncbi:MAG: flagellar hook-length control protein FliK [Thermodesulfobacteriota bacterium]
MRIVAPAGAGLTLADLQPTAGRPSAPPGQDSPFRPGQLVAARILGPAAGGGLLLEINGQELMAETDLTLPAGRSLWLLVRQAEPAVVLSPVLREEALADLGRQLAASAPAIGRILTTLLDEGTDLPAPLAALRRDLAALAADSVARPQALLRLLAGLQGRTPGPETGGAGLLDRLTEGISLRAAGPLPLPLAGLEDLRDLMAALTTANDRPATDTPAPVLALPFWFAGGAGWGTWLMTSGQAAGQAGRPGVSCLLFQLAMSRLGDVGLKVTLQGQTLDGVFTLSDEAARQHLAQSLPALEKTLASLGFAPVRLAALQSDRAPLAAILAALHRASGAPGTGLVDVTV